MKIIGLTGGIGSGKSIVSGVFETLGIPVYNSDIEAKNLTHTNRFIRENLMKKFGDDIYINTVLDKKKLANFIFQNKEHLNYVNSIVHPIVKDHFNTWLKKQEAKFIIKESAILIETGIDKDTDILISVLAPKAIRIKRIMQRDKLSQTEIEARILNQTNDEERIKKSDYLIENDGKKLLLPQILHIFSEIKSKYNNYA